MNKINIKPLSVNRAWAGKRFKTQDYKAFEIEMYHLLPGLSNDFKGKLTVVLEFGLSSKNADIDNPVKMTVDCLQKVYNFNDKQIYKMNLKKVDVKKGEEYIKFEIKKLLTTLI